MNKRATDLGLQGILLNAPVAAAETSIETDSICRDPIFIGRDDDVPILVDMLTHVPDDRPFSIAALVGMGGMGKTTLTKKVFNHENIMARFGSLIWVHVSQTFDSISFFNKIYSTLTSKTSDRVENFEIKQVILEKLQEALKAKTYLLALDDVWNEDVLKWKDFMNSMEGVTSTKGNCIIITTRKENVASIADPFHVHLLKGLSDSDCWSIIKANVSDGNGEVPSLFENIGREIATRCQGLPLAANVVGGVLRRCKFEQEWRSIKENWLSDDEGGENISKILKLSFDYLPSPSLKKCFAYCSIFPKGWKMKEEEMIELWIWSLKRVRDKEEAMKANMLQKSNLSKLVFKWDEDSDADRNAESVLEGLQPHANLKVLWFVGYKGKTFPTWCKKMAVQDGPQGSWVQLDNLIKIALVNCSECEEISMLEHLPNLKSLSLDNLKKVGWTPSIF